MTNHIRAQTCEDNTCEVQGQRRSSDAEIILLQCYTDERLEIIEAIK